MKQKVSVALSGSMTYGTGYVASVIETLLGLVGLGGEFLIAHVYECVYSSAVGMCV